MSESGQEKTEKPTERRKKDARQKGTVAKSVDLIGAVVFICLLMALPSVVSGGFKGLTEGFRASMQAISLEPTTANIGRVTIAAAKPILPSLALLIGVAMAVGVASNFAQVGFVISGEALTPSFNKLNPAQGIKRLFSKNSLFDAGKSLLKLFIFSWMTYTAIQAHWTELGMIWSLTPLGSLGVIGNIAKSIMMRLGFAWFLLACFDYYFQRKRVGDQLKMTKEEVKQEYKDAESSPEMKGARIRRHRQMMRKQTSAAVKSADVIITNPTHFAIAIKYEQGKHYAPMVVAKGVDHLALKIREMATEAKVPIVENRPLARALYKQCEVGDYVPRDLFQPVAEVLAYVYKTIKRVRR